MLHLSVYNIAKAAQSWQMQQADRVPINKGLPYLSGRKTASSLKKLSHSHQLCLAVRLSAITYTL